MKLYESVDLCYQKSLMITATNKTDCIMMFTNDVLYISDFIRTWKCIFSYSDALIHTKNMKVECQNPFEFVMNGLKSGEWRMEKNTLSITYKLDFFSIRGRIEMELCMDNIVSLKHIFFELIQQQHSLDLPPPYVIENKIKPEIEDKIQPPKPCHDLMFPNRRRRIVKKGPQYLKCKPER